MSKPIFKKVIIYLKIIGISLNFLEKYQKAIEIFDEAIKLDSS